MCAVAEEKGGGRWREKKERQKWEENEALILFFSGPWLASSELASLFTTHPSPSENKLTSALYKAGLLMAHSVFKWTFLSV